MQRYVLEVPAAETAFFDKLIQSLRFVRRVEESAGKNGQAPPAAAEETEEDEDRPPTKEEFLADLREAYLEAKEIVAGRATAPTLTEFLDELPD